MPLIGDMFLIFYIYEMILFMSITCFSDVRYLFTTTFIVCFSLSASSTDCLIYCSLSNRKLTSCSLLDFINFIGPTSSFCLILTYDLDFGMSLMSPDSFLELRTVLLLLSKDSTLSRGTLIIKL